MDFIEIGRVVKTHGYEGNLQMEVDDQFDEYIHELSFVFIMIRPDTYIPFQIVTILRSQNQQLTVKLKRVDHLEAAKALKAKEVFLHREQLGEMDLPILDTHLIGFTIYDQHKKMEVGVINELTELPGQLLANVLYGEKEVLIPLIEELIIDINEEAQNIIMELPEGILDL